MHPRTFLSLLQHQPDSAGRSAEHFTGGCSRESKPTRYFLYKQIKQYFIVEWKTPRFSDESLRREKSSSQSIL